MKKITLCFALVFSVCALRAEDKKEPVQKPLIVHEWGTFTSLQDEQGNAIGGINTDDEPVPAFVHKISYGLLVPRTQAPLAMVKAAPACQPDVTMRLETPVLYFHPPAGWKPRPVDVQVQFRGGWLTEFFPNASFEAPGMDRQHPDQPYTSASKPLNALSFGHIRSDAMGKLSWQGLTLGAGDKFMETDEKVWLAPRDVKSATVKEESGESEKFIFYRGIGNVDASLKIGRNGADHTLEVHDNSGPLDMKNAADLLRIHAAWLVDVKPDGTCAFKTLGALDYGKDIRAVMPASFDKGDIGGGKLGYASGNMERLRGEMRAALVKEGLYEDEADALLNTWQVSYFKSPGLRFFYLCPRAITDTILPLKISTPAEVTRVMIGRIEIVTPEQRELLKKLAAGPAPDLKVMYGNMFDKGTDFFQHPENVKTWEAVMSGKSPYTAFGFPIPELYADYLKLGRFRNALILDAQKHDPTPALAQFISDSGLRAYQVDPPAKADVLKKVAASGAMAQ